MMQKKSFISPSKKRYVENSVLKQTPMNFKIFNRENIDPHHVFYFRKKNFQIKYQQGQYILSSSSSSNKNII